MTRKQIRDIYEECQRRESCYYCPYEDDYNCNMLWDYTGCTPSHQSYEELEKIVKIGGLLDDD